MSSVVEKVAKVANPVEHIKIVTDHLPVPQEVKVIVDTTAAVTSAPIESIIEHPVHVIEKVVEAIKDPKLEKIIAAVPGDPTGVIHTPAEIIEDIRQITSVGNIGELIEKSAQMAVKSTLKSTGTMPAVYACVEAHLQNLQEQATLGNKWKNLSQVIIDIFKSHYSVNLSLIRYAEDIDTKQQDTAITFPGEIFFPRLIDPEHNYEDLHWLLHELTHEEQYQRLGGLHGYLDQYSSDIVVKIISRGTFDPHDKLEYEIEAKEKADVLTPLLIQKPLPYSH